jgi:hypothetical protein
MQKCAACICCLRAIRRSRKLAENGVGEAIPILKRLMVLFDVGRHSVSP